MTEHMNEPWVYRRNSPNSVDVSSAHTGQVLMGVKLRDLVCMMSHHPGKAEQAIAEANARRIVACVNACAGIPLAALDSGVLTDLMNLAWDAMRLADRGGSEDAFSEHGNTAKALTERFRAAPVEG